MDFWRTVEVLGKRKWLIFLCIVAAVALTYGATRLTGTKWQSSVAFMAPDKVSGVKMADDTDGQGDAAQNNGGDRNEATIYDNVVKSRDVVEPVLSKLGYTDVPLNFFQDVEFTTTGPNLYELSVTDTSRSRSQDLANALAWRFLVVYQALRTSQARDTLARLQDQMKDNTAKLDEANAKFDAYRRAHEIVGSPDTSLAAAVGDSGSLTAKRDDAAAAYERDAAALAAVQREIAATASTPPSQIALTHPLLDGLRTELESAQNDLDTLRTNRTDEHPLVKAAIERRDAIQARLDAESKAIASTPVGNPSMEALKSQEASLMTQAAASKATLDAISGQTSASKEKLAGLTTADAGATQATMSIKELTDMRTNLDERLNAARLALDDAARQNPITVMNWVNPYNPPVNMTQGRTTKLLVIAALAALLLACGIIIGLDRVDLDRRVKNMREAEVNLPTRLLAAIPQPSAALSYAGLARITETHPMSLYSEAYRFLGLHLLSIRGDCKSIMTLSAKAEQGSTTTITNLGITLAQAGKRVIIVDANMRTAELHTVFNVENDFGFTDLLETPSAASMERALHETEVPGLHFITSGNIPKNPWALFRSGNLQAVSQQLKGMADYVLYDTPSSLMFTDALNLAPVVDGAILCVRAFQPLTGTEQRIIDMLEQSNVTVLGSVLNDVPTSMLEAFTNYQEYYENGSNGNKNLVGAATSIRAELPPPSDTTPAAKSGFITN